MSGMRVKKNDIVVATRGVGAGKTGKVLQVLPGKGRAIVEGVRMIKKAVRKARDNQQGGIIEKEGSIALSNLMLYCPQCKKGVRVRREKTEGKTVRRCVKCKHSFDG